MKLNCPNCGAPIDKETNKCPYCNTSYFDLSCIDINGQEPFYLKIKDGNMVFTSLVKFNNCEITFNVDEANIYGGLGEKLYQMKRSYSINTNLKLESVFSLNGKTTTTVVFEQ